MSLTKGQYYVIQTYTPEEDNISTPDPHVLPGHQKIKTRLLLQAYWVHESTRQRNHKSAFIYTPKNVKKAIDYSIQEAERGSPFDLLFIPVVSVPSDPPLLLETSNEELKEVDDPEEEDFTDDGMLVP
jgi:hypothetical protein